MEFGILSILPSVLSIVIALAFKNVLFALLSAIFLSNLILNSWSLFPSLQGSLNGLIGVFQSTSSTKIIIALLLIGGMIHAIDKSGGISGFINFMVKRRSLIKSKRAAMIFTWIIGALIFTVPSLSIMVAGSISKPINKALKVPSEKLAHIIHSVGSGFSILVPISIFAPFLIGLSESAGMENGVTALFKSIPLNFYSILTVFGLLAFMILGREIGPMKKCMEAAEKLEVLDDEGNKEDEKKGKLAYLLTPMVVLFTVIIAVMFATGQGNFVKGDGYGAILWGLISAIVGLGLLVVKDKVFKVDQYISEVFKGSGGMLMISTILVLAFAFGSLVSQLGAGPYLANNLLKFVSPKLLPAMVFFVSCLMSFATGTSAGTLSVMGPLALPMALSMEANFFLVLGAVCGGSIFGDQSSPISDSTIITASIADCSVEDHVRTQLPYSLLFGGVSVVLYVVLGLII